MTNLIDKAGSSLPGNNEATVTVGLMYGVGAAVVVGLVNTYVLGLLGLPTVSVEVAQGISVIATGVGQRLQKG